MHGGKKAASHGAGIKEADSRKPTQKNQRYQWNWKKLREAQLAIFQGNMLLAF